ncbi:hypothetical protein A7X89_11165 [Stenotrophomonas maltophilia]|nr:hypothetical protein A7X89_11165 [Stenotrophomonas maltophilia]
MVALVPVPQDVSANASSTQLRATFQQRFQRPSLVFGEPAVLFTGLLQGFGNGVHAVDRLGVGDGRIGGPRVQVGELLLQVLDVRLVFGAVLDRAPALGPAIACPQACGDRGGQQQRDGQELSCGGLNPAH